jgi:hypothetical protein
VIEGKIATDADDNNFRRIKLTPPVFGFFLSPLSFCRIGWRTLHGIGHLAEAEKIYRQVFKAQPDHL